MRRRILKSASRTGAQRGQFIVGGIVFLCALMITVQAMVWFTQREAVFTHHNATSTAAFYLAEAGLQRGLNALDSDSNISTTLLAGHTISGYNFDQTYSDVHGGYYSLKLSTASGSTIVITSVGRDAASNSVRALQSTYSGAAGAPAAAMFTVGIASVTGTTVNWGPIYSLQSIVTTLHYPRMFSAGAITWDTNGPTAPNSDGTQWWSYDANLPNAPAVDLAYYKALAQSQGAGHVIDACTYTNNNLVLGQVNGTYYITKDGACQASLGKNSFITGNLIVEGDLTTTKSASVGSGSYSADIPPYAWMEYGHSAIEWSQYLTWDPTAPPTYAAAVAQNYVATGKTTTLSNVIVHGFTYVGGNLILQSGGTVNFHGTLIVGGQAQTSNSNVSFYYDPTTAVQTSQSTLTQSSWQEVGNCTWTGSGAPVCH